MVPDIAAKGHSFKGAMAYYLHDKRQDMASPQPETSERVAWTVNRNIAVDDPHAAMHIMIATAKSADELKAAAGVSNAGRKSNAHVYAYSLAWHPDEAGQLDQVEMLRAADLSLKALKADHLQAVIVCHQDQKHPHIHIVLNRVDPATGKMHGFSKDREILSEWANQYERERGQILTPKREEKRVLQEAFAKAKESGIAPPRIDQERPKAPTVDKSPAAMLKELGDAQKARHKVEWGELAAQQQPERDKIYSAYAARIKEAAARHKTETKAIWGAYFKAVRSDQRAFAEREKTVGGIIRNALTATTHQQITGKAGDRGKLSLVFANVLSAQARQAAFSGQLDMNRQKLATVFKAQLDREIAGLKDKRAADLAAQRVAFGNARTSLIERQNAESAKVREAWRQIYADRGKDPSYKPRSTPRPAPVRSPQAAMQAKGQNRQYRDHANAAASSRTLQTAMQARDRALKLAQDKRAWQAERDQKKAAMQGKAVYRRDVATPTAQQAKIIDRMQPPTEQPTMKNEFDNARAAEKRPTPIAPTKTAFVSTAAPSPAPTGETPRPAPKEAQQIPKAAPPPAPVKAATPRQDFAAQSAAKPAAPASPPRKDWGKVATPATPAATSSSPTPAQPKKDWTKAATPAAKEQNNNPTRSGPRRS